VYNDVKATIDAFADGKVHPRYAFAHLLSLKKVEKKAEEPPADTTATEAVVVETPAENVTGTPANN
jgi:hypothetical protein